jgi:hypothetical protein
MFQDQTGDLKKIIEFILDKLKTQKLTQKKVRLKEDRKRIKKKKKKKKKKTDQASRPAGPAGTAHARASGQGQRSSISFCFFF